MSELDPKLFEHHARRFYPERLLRPSTLNEGAGRVEELLRAIDVPTAYGESETIAIPTQLLSDIALAIANLLKANEPMQSALDTMGMDEDSVCELIETYHEVIQGKYEHDQDERIVLAALVLHLVEGSPTQSSKDLSRNLARKVITGFNEPPMIDEPVDETYAKQLIESLDDNS